MICGIVPSRRRCVSDENTRPQQDTAPQRVAYLEQHDNRKITCPLVARCRWLSLLWNHTIAPAVSAAVIRGSGAGGAGAAGGAGGQQKVANTALYVLMQRAIVSGCPLSGQGQSSRDQRSTKSVFVEPQRFTVCVSHSVMPKFTSALSWLSISECLMSLRTIWRQLSRLSARTEKERYLAGFNGSNELDIKMRLKGESSPATPPGGDATPPGGDVVSPGREAVSPAGDAGPTLEALIAGHTT